MKNAKEVKNQLRKLFILTIALGLVLVLSGVAMAAGTANVDVTATVLSRCSFKTAGAMAFGSLDPSVGSAVTGSPTNPTFKCTKGITYTITDDKGANEGNVNCGGNPCMTNGADYIVYSISYTASGTAAAGASQALTLTGNIAAGAYQDASAGSYTDTFVLSINP